MERVDRMRYLFAILLPPIAVLSCKKPFSALLNLILCCFFVIPGIVHALFVVSNYNADARMNKLEKTIAKSASK